MCAKKGQNINYGLNGIILELKMAQTWYLDVIYVFLYVHSKEPQNYLYDFLM